MRIWWERKGEREKFRGKKNNVAIHREQLLFVVSLLLIYSTIKPNYPFFIANVIFNLSQLDLYSISFSTVIKIKYYLNGVYYFQNFKIIFKKLIEHFFLCSWFCIASASFLITWRTIFDEKELLDKSYTHHIAI